MAKLTALIVLFILSTLSVAETQYIPYSDDLPVIEQNVLKEQTQQWILESYPKNVNDNVARVISEHLLVNAKRYSMDLEFLVGVVSIESGFKIKAESKEGAKGLMQVVSRWHLDKIKGRSLFDPKVALEVGSTVLQDCLIKTKHNRLKALGCYSGKSGIAAKEYYTLVMAKSRLFKSHLLIANIPVKPNPVEVNKQIMVAYEVDPSAF